MLKYLELFRPSLLVTSIFILILGIAFSVASVVSPSKQNLLSKQQKNRQIKKLRKEYRRKRIPVPSWNQFVTRRYYEKYLNRNRHFKFYEIKSKSRNPRYNVAVFRINDKLEKVRKNLYGHRLIINSGYRNPKHNSRIGGVKRSRHMYGKAVDIKIEDFDGSGGRFTYLDRRLLLKAARAAGAKALSYKNHVHLSWR